MRGPKQLEAWRGAFGREYTDRNVQDPAVVMPAFARMLEGLSIRKVLEVGCNRGHNLVALVRLLGEDAEVVGVEPNPYARAIARRSSDRIGVVGGHASDIPFKSGYFDLVFTSGVLIHVSSDDLPQCLRELHRVSRRYVLAIEYFAETETPIRYRGHDDLLWKRDFLRSYQDVFPDLQLVRGGHVSEREGFDDCAWWLLEKPGTERT